MGHFVKVYNVVKHALRSHRPLAKPIHISKLPTPCLAGDSLDQDEDSDVAMESVYFSAESNLDMDDGDLVSRP